ncbi:MAG: hypothetical protein GF313_07495, partial [Caldithrix sp.]|nr:hypothetical protein [Caldithrix sp.]
MKKNHITLIIAGLISILNLLYPPWNYTVVQNNNKIIRDAGYNFFWKTPSVPVTSEKEFSSLGKVKFYNNISVNHWSSEINLVRLGIQLL